MAGVAIFGASGRMGQSLVRGLREANEGGAAPPLVLSGALVSATSARLGLDAAAEGPFLGVTLVADVVDALQGAQVAVDFSLPQCIADNARACVRAGVPLLVGATGFDAVTRLVLDTAARSIAVLVAPNTSIGVTVMAHLVERAARALSNDFDIEISEAHHRSKRDAPSGTALRLGEVAAAARGQLLSEVAVSYGEARPGPRPAGAIGFAVTRGGDIVGEHTVTYAGAGERLDITHRATDRMIFARGALRAAAWLIGQPPGAYRMGHALGLEQP